MPSQSPIGGFSLILHITINVFSFIYKNIKKVLDRWELNTPDKYIKYIFNKDGNTFFRRFFSYILVLIIFFSINGMGVYVVYTAIKSRTEQKVSNIPPFIQKSYELTYDYNIKKPQEIQNLASLSSITMDKNEDLNISLVENLTILGVKDPSFEFRARLAEEFDVISDENQYNGSPSQNLIILRRMQNNPEFTGTILKKISGTN